MDSFFEQNLFTMSRHKERFISLIINRFRGESLYILDEPESALSPNKQLSLLSIMNALIKQGAQFIIATHSLIIMSYLESGLYQFSDDGISLHNIGIQNIIQL